MKCWMLYDSCDLMVNRDFVTLMKKHANAIGLNIEAVEKEKINIFLDEHGKPCCLQDGKINKPDIVLSRQRDFRFSEHFELMGVKVYNNSRVCRICNDKWQTHQFLNNLPMLKTYLITNVQLSPPLPYPFIAKPVGGHGGKGVCLIENKEQWCEYKHTGEIIIQEVAKYAGVDVRVYVLDGDILTAVKRTANHGIISNFKLGGSVSLYSLSKEERQLVELVIQRFELAGAPLKFAGVDLLYHSNGAVIGEIEDVVGSRMLYQVSDIDIAKMLLDNITSYGKACESDT